MKLDFSNSGRLLSISDTLIFKPNHCVGRFEPWVRIAKYFVAASAGKQSQLSVSETLLQRWPICNMISGAVAPIWGVATPAVRNKGNA